MKKHKIFTSLLIVSMIVGTVIVWKIPEVAASEYTLQDLEQQITDAIDWIDRMVYIEINSTHAVATDTPQLSFRVKHSDGTWTISGKTREENLPNGADMIEGWAYVEDASDRGVITNYVDKSSMLYKWDLDENGNYDNLELYVEYATVNDSWTQLYGKVDTFSGEGGITYDLYLETQQVISSIAEDETFSITKEWGWTGRRYTIRPTVKGLADLYYNLATISYPWLGGQTYQQYRGVNYTDRAMKLYRTWYQSGYIIDRFDGEYGVTMKTRPYPEIHEGIPVNPDLIKEPEYYPGIPDYGAYYITSPTSFWYNYSNVPPPQIGPPYTEVYRFATCSRHAMPENEEWINVPFQCSNTEFIFPYKSRTGFEWARNAYIANGLEFDIEHFNARIPLPGIELVLGIGTDAKSIRACHDMYKYGKDIPYGLSTLKTEFIDYGITTWDGNGIAFDSWKGTPIGWPYAAYGTHNTATFGNALIQYYKLTGDSYYAKKADKVVGILTMVQNKLGKSVESRSRNREFYRAEYVGSFLPGYGVAYSFGQQDIYSTGLVDLIYWGLDKAGIFKEDPQPFTYPCLGNAEVTIPAVWTMIEYRTLNRIPSVPEIPDYVLPTDNVVVYTDHGGSYGGDGSIEICNDAVATKIGGDTGNVWKYVGNINRFRMTAVAALFQEAWATIEYNWDFTLTSAVTNWRTKLYFTIPYLHGSGGNSLTIWVELYNSEGILVVSESKIPLDGYAEPYGFGKMFFWNNLTFLSSLSAGTYTIKLRFKCHAGYGQLYLGYTFYPPYGPPYEALPIGLESFGYDCDPDIAESTPTYDLHVSSNGPGSTSPSDTLNFAEGETANVSAIPNSEKYFWYWNLNNTKLGTSINYTMNPSIIYMDHDYNLTAYFSNVPPDEIISYILILGVYGQGHTNPAEGKYSYVNGTQVILTAISDGGWFTGWSIYSDGSGQYSTQNPLTITMNKDYIVIAGFDLTVVKFDFEEYSGTQKSAAYIGKSPVSVYYRYHGATAWYYLGDFVDKPDGTGDGCFQSPGIYDYCFKLQGHYPSYIYNVNLDSPEKILIVKLYRQDFIAGGGIPGRRPLLMSEP